MSSSSLLPSIPFFLPQASRDAVYFCSLLLLLLLSCYYYLKIFLNSQSLGAIKSGCVKCTSLHCLKLFTDFPSYLEWKLGSCRPWRTGLLAPPPHSSFTTHHLICPNILAFRLVPKHAPNVLPQSFCICYSLSLLCPHCRYSQVPSLPYPIELSAETSVPTEDYPGSPVDPHPIPESHSSSFPCFVFIIALSTFWHNILHVMIFSHFGIQAIKGGDGEQGLALVVGTHKNALNKGMNGVLTSL